MFFGLLQDLFPGLNPESKKDEVLKEAVDRACEDEVSGIQVGVMKRPGYCVRSEIAESTLACITCTCNRTSGQLHNSTRSVFNWRSCSRSVIAYLSWALLHQVPKAHSPRPFDLHLYTVGKSSCWKTLLAARNIARAERKTRAVDLNPKVKTSRLLVA